MLTKLALALSSTSMMREKPDKLRVSAERSMLPRHHSP
jgi:hypothetical protein